MNAESPDEAPARPTRLRDLPRREAELLELLLLGAESAGPLLAEIDESRLASDAARRVHRLCAEQMATHGDVDFQRLMLVVEDERLKSLLVEIDEAGQAKLGSDRQRRVADVLAAYDREQETAHRRRRHSALREGGLDENQEEQALGEIFANLKNRQT